MAISAFPLRPAALSLSLLALAACSGGFDYDFRGGAGAFDTSDAVRNLPATAPQPDARGVISYPGYQVAVARRGDTVNSVAARVGLPATDLARYNALPPDVPLREGEIVALPVRIAEPGASTGVDVASMAGQAIDRAEGTPGLPGGAQPIRHQVQPGETAFSIARQYGVPVATLAEWNGLGPNLDLRVGQYLLIPTAPADTGVQTAALPPVTAPGAGSPTPLPPSASKPLPSEDVKPSAKPAPPPADLSRQQTAASDTARLRMPVQGSIIRTYQKGKNEGIGIAAPAGTAVVAADDGTVAAITRDTEQVPILVIRHEGNLLTVYAGVDKISVKKGDKVKRGEKIAVIRSANPAFLHFEVREGFDSVDPMPYLQ